MGGEVGGVNVELGGKGDRNRWSLTVEGRAICRWQGRGGLRGSHGEHGV